METIKVFAMPELDEQSMDGSIISSGGNTNTVNIKDITSRIVDPYKLNISYVNTGNDGTVLSAQFERIEAYLSSEDREKWKAVSQLYGNDALTQGLFNQVVKDAIAYATINCQNVDINNSYGGSIITYKIELNNNLEAHPRFTGFINTKDTIEACDVYYSGTSYASVFDLITIRINAISDGGENKDPDLEIKVFTTSSYFRSNYSEPIYSFYYPNSNFDLQDLIEFDDAGVTRYRIAPVVDLPHESVIGSEMGEIKSLYRDRDWNTLEWDMPKKTGSTVKVWILYDNITDPISFFDVDKVKSNFVIFLRDLYRSDANFAGKGEAYIDEFLRREWSDLIPAEQRRIIPIPFTFPFTKNDSLRDGRDSGLIDEGITHSDSTMTLSFGRLLNIVRDDKYDGLILYSGDSGVTVESANQTLDNITLEVIPHSDLNCPHAITPGITDILPQWQGKLVEGGGAIDVSSADLINEFYMVLSFLNARVLEQGTYQVPVAEDLTGDIATDIDSIVGRFSIVGTPTSDISTFTFQSIEFVYRQTELIAYHNHLPENRSI